jgi:hypothetical protein
MGWLDKLLGRAKATAGEATESTGLREEGRAQESAARPNKRGVERRRRLAAGSDEQRREDRGAEREDPEDHRRD